MVRQLIQGFIGSFTQFFKGFSAFDNPTNEKRSLKGMNPPDSMGQFSSEREKKNSWF